MGHCDRAEEIDNITYSARNIDVFDAVTLKAAARLLSIPWDLNLFQEKPPKYRRSEASCSNLKLYVHHSII